MTKVYDLPQIEAVINEIDLEAVIEKGFVEYSMGNAVVPPVGELIFNEPPGDTHIKYGYLKGQNSYVIKIASGFYDNPRIGLSSSSGLMMVFSQKTGFPEAILLDDGFLTDVRTAVAGQICAKYLSPDTVSRIGMIGTGIQARMQVRYLKETVDCMDVIAWGPTLKNANKYKADMEAMGYRVKIVDSPGMVAQNADLVITSTPSKTPLLNIQDIRPGTHITAMGSDTKGKQELDPEILKVADLVVADSLAQCRVRGEISMAFPNGEKDGRKIMEIGEIIQSPESIQGRHSGITVADLTGVAVQDIQIATAVCRALGKMHPDNKKEVGHH